MILPDTQSFTFTFFYFIRFFMNLFSGSYYFLNYTFHFIPHLKKLCRTAASVLASGNAPISLTAFWNKSHETLPLKSPAFCAALPYHVLYLGGRPSTPLKVWYTVGGWSKKLSTIHSLKLFDRQFFMLIGRDWVRESSVADPDPGLGAFLTPGSGIPDGRKSSSGSGIRDEQPGSYFLELRNHFFCFFWV